MNRIFDSIGLMDFLFILKKHLLFIAGVTLVLALACFSYGKFFTTPQYRASASVLINSLETAKSANGTGETSDTYQLSQTMLNTYTGVMQSKDVLEKTVTSLQLPIKSDQLLKALSINGFESSEIVNIQITYPSAAVAQSAFYKILEISQDKMKNIYPGIHAEIISKPESDTQALSRHTKTYTLFGFLAGLFLSVLAAFLYEITSNRIRSERDVQLLDLPLLGVVPRENGRDSLREER